MSDSGNAVIQSIIDQLRDVQAGKLWMGGNYERKLAQVDEASVFKRPIRDLHSVAEIISHLTLWRKETILKVKTGKGSKTDDCEENWLGNEALQRIGWPALLQEYQNTLTELIDLLATKDDSFLEKKYYDTDFKGDYPYSFVLNGMLHHDIYHLGQLGLIIKFLKNA